MKRESSHIAVVVSVASVLSCGLLQSNAAVIFSESLGTVSGTTTIASHEVADGFDNDAFTFSGTADLRATTASTGYAGASGSANVYLTTSGSPRFTIAGVSTLGFTVGSVDVSFGAYKNSVASDMTTLVLEYGTDGSGWTALGVPAQPTGTGTTGWRLISLSDTSIPITSTLFLRWTSSDTSTQFRIDDVTLSGTAVPETSAAVLGSLGLLGLLRRRRSN